MLMSESDLAWWHWLAHTYIMWLHIHSKFVDYSSKISFWELYLFHEAIFKSNLKNSNDQQAQ